MKTDNFDKKSRIFWLTLCRKWEENVRKQKLIQKCKKICQIWQKIEKNAAFDREINIFYSVETNKYILFSGDTGLSPGDSSEKELYNSRSPGQITSSPGSAPDDSLVQFGAETIVWLIVSC